MHELLPSLPGLLNEVFSGMGYLLPEIILVGTFILVILSGLFLPGKKNSLSLWLCLLGMILSQAVLWAVWQRGASTVWLFGQMLIFDKMSVVLRSIFFFISILYAIFIRHSKAIEQHKKGAGDLYMLLPGVLLGLNLMSMASGLLMVYISIEMISIVSYLMVGYVAGDHRQTEAAMKYALFGSACSAMMLYGMSLIYGFTGTLSLYDPRLLSNLAQMPASISGLGIVLMLAGIGFKLSFVPLHFWSPDVYEGAPTPVTAFLSTGPKVAGFAVLIRVVTALTAYPLKGPAPMVFDFTVTLSVVAILSMILGNFVAIWQNNIKRLLAYSSIGHTGFILMAVIANGTNGNNALIFYLLIYAIMNMAAFMVAGLIEERSGATTVAEYKGLGKLLKGEMVCFVLILISLTGLPPLAGFVAKFLVFAAVFEKYSSSHSPWLLALLVTGAVTTVVSLFYYFKIPLNAFLRTSDHIPVIKRGPAILTLIIFFLTFLLLLWGVLPGLIV